MQNYNKIINKKNTLLVRQPPSYLNYFEFKKEEDSKALAKAVIKGEIDFSGEDKKLDKMLFQILKKTEKYQVKCFNSPEKRKDFALKIDQPVLVANRTKNAQLSAAHSSLHTDVSFAEESLTLPGVDHGFGSKIRLDDGEEEEIPVSAAGERNLTQDDSVEEDVFKTETSKFLLSDKWDTKYPFKAAKNHENNH